MRRPLLVLALTLSTALSLASQQEPARTTRAEAVDRIAAGRRIRIAPSDGPVVEGMLVAREGLHLVLRYDARLDRVPLARIDQLWERGRATGIGALIGGITGGAVGTALGLLIGEVICDNEDCDANTLEAVALLGGGGAAGGALLGAGIGSLIPKWRLRFP